MATPAAAAAAKEVDKKVQLMKEVGSPYQRSHCV
jgi:hypothetical protein